MIEGVKKQSAGVRRNLKEIQRRRGHEAKLRLFRERQREFNLLLHPKKEYADFPASKVFSILTSRAETVAYLKKIDRNLNDGIYTRMNLSSVEQTDLATVCLLSGYMLDSHTPGTFLEVRIPPKGTKSRKLFEEVEFQKMVIRQQRRRFTSGRFLSRSSKTVNNGAIQDILDATVRFFGKDKLDRLNDLSPVIVEIVENAVFWADPRENKSLPWIFNTRTINGPDYKEIEYCIVDLGVGMYASIKQNVDKWNTITAKTIHRLTSALNSSTTQSSFLAKNIPSGIGSSTNSDERGYGVQYVYQQANNDMYQVFDIITNKAHVKLKDMLNPVADIDEDLSATVYYWKIRFYD
ncbi:MAG TPA: hypothetical protein VLG09_02150 [Candidatus Saccharimonadales bacterium]|nr:hypothetical protein [Candidatus Saccharimonadales bacterium]